MKWEVGPVVVPEGRNYAAARCGSGKKGKEHRAWRRGQKKKWEKKVEVGSKLKWEVGMRKAEKKTEDRVSGIREWKPED